MNKSKIIIILSWTAVLLWLVLIFYLSSQPAIESDGLSKKVTEVIIDKVDWAANLDVGKPKMVLVAQFNHLVRKYAHAGVYFVLGVLVMNAARSSGMMGVKAFVFSFMFCILYAISDEAHQLFVSGRGAQVTDALIDSLGAFAGAYIWGVLSRICTRTILQ